MDLFHEIKMCFYRRIVVYRFFNQSCQTYDNIFSISEKEIALNTFESMLNKQSLLKELA